MRKNDEAIFECLKIRVKSKVNLAKQGDYTAFMCYLPYQFLSIFKASFNRGKFVVKNECFCNYEIAYKYSVYADNSKTYIKIS